MTKARRCIPAGSFPCTKGPARVTPKIQRRLVYEALQRLPADFPDQLPDKPFLRHGADALGRAARHTLSPG